MKELKDINKKYSIIYVDPPWQYKSKENLSPKSYLNKTDNFHYETLSKQELLDMKLQISNLVDKRHCLLFLWVVNPMLDEAINLMKHWGFEYKTVAFIWDKVNPTMGHYTMAQCEMCIVGKIGKIPNRVIKNTRQFLSLKKEKHSKKPDEIRDRIKNTFDVENRIELFAREESEGWDAWGDEV